MENQLTDEQHHILREKGTEPPWSGEYVRTFSFEPSSRRGDVCAELYRDVQRAQTEAPQRRNRPNEKVLYVSLHDDGMYHCVGCDALLFSSDAKFDSGSGWPSFDRSHAPDSVELTPDTSLDMTRTEVICRSCNGHLGHLFDDGPTETGKRFCVNSRALKFYAS